MSFPANPKEIPHYIAPVEAPFPGSLGRYLKGLPANVLEAYLEVYTTAGDVVLDPFTRTPALAHVSAHLGRKAVLADSNPVATFAVRASLLPVTGQDLKRAFGKISDGKVGAGTLPAYLDDLFATVCPRCGNRGIATELVWDGRFGVPLSKRVACSTCCTADREPVEGPVTAEDLALAREVQTRGPHYREIIARFGSASGAGGSLAAELLDLYTPRVALALEMLLRRVEQGDEGPNVQAVLKLCLLECLSACLKLESEPPGSPRGDDIRLEPPDRFLERNPWRWFAQTVQHTRHRLEQRGGEARPPRLTASITRVLDGNAYGRLGSPPNTIVLQQAARRLEQEMTSGTVSLAIGAPPGPDEGLFTCLSYLWGGWLLGADNLQGLEQIPTTMRPMEWEAYYRAVGSALSGLTPVMRSDGRLVLLVAPASEPQYMALALAGVATGLHLDRLLLQAEAPRQMALEFSRPAPEQTAAAESLAALDERRLGVEIRHSVDEALRGVLALRAEPTGELWLRAAALESLSRSGALMALLVASDFAQEPVLRRLHTEVQEAVERGLRKHVLVRDDAAGDLTLARLPTDAVALCDRAEIAVYHHLSANRRTSLANAERVVHTLFPGLSTPDNSWLEWCLASYGTGDRGGRFSLRPNDTLANRLDEHAQAIALLVELGRRYGFHVWIAREEQKRAYGDGRLGDLLTVGERYASPGGALGGSQAADVDVVWYDGGTAVWLFEVEWSAAFSQAVVGRRLAGSARRFLVIADDRLPLVDEKLNRFAWLRAALERDGWLLLTWSGLATAATRAGAGPESLAAAARRWETGVTVESRATGGIGTP